MSFLQYNPLWLLPLILLPILIHLINQRRHRTVKWGAMMFLLNAKKMNKGMARIRQILIMTARMLVVAGLVFAICRPLASGWFGSLAGGKPESVIVLLDRSSSMQVQRFETGESKVASGVRKIADMLQTIGHTGDVVLIDSNTREPRILPDYKALNDMADFDATGAAADIPALMETAMEYVSNNSTGRTDVWLCSDSQREDWDPDSSRWSTLRSSFSRLDGVRFHVLTYADPPKENMSVRVDSVKRAESADGAEVVLDLTVRRSGDSDGKDVELEFVVNGIRSRTTVSIDQSEARLLGHRIPVDKDTKSGWGRVELPADANPGDDIFFFTYAKRPIQKTVIVSDDPQKVRGFELAAQIALDRSTRTEAELIGSDQISGIDWNETACVIWHAAMPEDFVREQLENFVKQGRPVIFLPPEQNEIDASADRSFAGIRWKSWAGQQEGAGYELSDTWREDTDLLATSEDGIALPLFDTRVYLYCTLEGGPVPLASLKNGDYLLSRAAMDGGGAYFLSTLPVGTHSSLARDGLVLFAMIQRAINKGLETIGSAKLYVAGTGAANAVTEFAPLSTPAKTLVDQDDGSVVLPSARPYACGIYGNEEQVVAINRPENEDRPVYLQSDELDTMFDGLDYSVIDDRLDNRQSLVSEVWRMFLIVMGIALVCEALLCLPPKAEEEAGVA